MRTFSVNQCQWDEMSREQLICQHAPAIFGVLRVAPDGQYCQAVRPTSGSPAPGPLADLVAYVSCFYGDVREDVSFAFCQPDDEGFIAALQGEGLFILVSRIAGPIVVCGRGGRRFFSWDADMEKVLLGTCRLLPPEMLAELTGLDIDTRIGSLYAAKGIDGILEARGRACSCRNCHASYHPDIAAVELIFNGG